MGTLNRKYFSDRICLLNLLLRFLYSIRYRLQGRFARNKTVCRRAVSKDAPISTKSVFPMPRMVMNTISHIIGIYYYNIGILIVFHHHPKIKKYIFIEFALHHVFLHVVICLQSQHQVQQMVVVIQQL